MMHYTFHINPCPAPRMTQLDRWKKRPIVLKYFGFRDYMKLQANVLGYKLTPVLDIMFVLPMPDSWSKKKKYEMDGMPHQSSGDIDNLIKATLDALTDQDNYVYRIKAEKKWGITGKIVIFDANPLIDHQI